MKFLLIKTAIIIYFIKILYETKEEGIQEGIEKGKGEAAVEIAKNLKDDLSDEDIAIRTNLPLDVVRKL